MKQVADVMGARTRAAIAAGLLSLVLHALLLERLPPIPIGRLVGDLDLPDYPSIALGDVFLEDEQAPRQFQGSTSGAEVIAALDAVADEQVDAAFPSPPPPDLAGNLEFLRAIAPFPPELPADASPGWQGREEILQITDRLVDDRIARLPRRLTEAIQRRAKVPDITLPVEPATDPASWGGGTAGQSAEFLARNLGWPTTGALPGRGRIEIRPAQPLAILTMDPPPVTNALRAAEAGLSIEVSAFRPRDESEPIYFSVRLKPAEERLAVMPKDVLFLQDCSESMTPARLADCKRGLRRWLDFVGRHDRFQVASFSDRVAFCFEQPWVEMSEQTRRRALAFIDAMRAVGNTDIFASLDTATRLPREPNRPLLVFLITDGRPTVGMTATSEIMERFTHANDGRASVFTIGAGRRANRYLLDLLSLLNRGGSWIVPDDDQLVGAMETCARETSRPLLADLRYRFSGIREEDVYPRLLTPLFQDRPLLLYGCADRSITNAAFQIVGRSGRELMDIVFSIDLQAATAGGPDLRTSWAWQRVLHLISEHARSGDPQLAEEIRSFGGRYGLSLPYGYGDHVPRR
ncbi:MAG: VWA domain-containing protein [Kiritimatiellae bacterium]|nr:VWA domain-containing protein [Kiritimatiellia bacterium]MDW8458356.1 VWA domain-containing protein [Verrucomicrobiota bacterium]